VDDLSVKRALNLTFSLYLLAVIPLTSRAGVIVWTNVTGGNWSVPANWSPNQVPASSDTTFITNAGIYSVGLDVNATLTGLNLGGREGSQTLVINGPSLTLTGACAVGTNALISLVAGTFGGSAAISVEGLLNVFGGSVGGSGTLTITPTGQLSLSGNANLGGRPIVNGGRLLWTDGTISNGSSLTNLADGTLDLLVGTNTFAVARIVNAGVINRRAGVGAAQIAGRLDNYGVVNVESGYLSLTRAGTHTNRFVVAAGATLYMIDFSTEPYDFSPSSSVTGDGNVAFATGTFNMNGTFNIRGLTEIINSSVVNFSTGYVLNGSPIRIARGTGNFNSGRMLMPSSLTMIGGTLTGNDSWTVSGPVTLIGGTTPTYVNVTLSRPGPINANGGLMISDQVWFLGGVINNAQTAMITGDLHCQSNAVINNLPGATFEIVDGLINGAGNFNNDGLTRIRTQAGNNWFIAIPFNNRGRLELESGAFNLFGGGTHSGKFDVGAGGALGFGSWYPGQFHVFTSGSEITGPGNIGFGSADVLGSVAVGGDVSITEGTNNFSGSYTNDGGLTVSGGTANFNTGKPITVARLTLSGGTLAGSDPIIVTGPTTWTGGMLKGPGTIDATGGLTMNGGTPVLDGRTLRNAGAATWNGGFIFTGSGSVISNAPSGVFDITFDGQTLVGSGGGRTFANAGLLRKLGGSGTATISDALLNTGTIEVRSGTLAFGNTFVQTAGSTLLNGGNLAASGLLQMQKGTLGGNGTVMAKVVNSGRCSPGTSPGLLRISGDYTQTSAGQLDVELGGTAAGATFDQLQVSGTASLAGTLNVTTVNSFHPALGQEFRILTFASRTGDFSSYAYPPENELTPRYDATGLTLVGGSTAPVLLITRQAQTLLLSWPSDATGYLLQQSTNLLSGSWSVLPVTTNSLVIIPGGTQSYFRLAKP
jgi:hypothetical protein